MADNQNIEIGTVLEVTGERASFLLTANPNQALAGHYYPGQPGTYVKIPFEDRAIIGAVSAVRIDDHCAPTEAKNKSRRIVDCMLIGSLTRTQRFERGVAVHPTVGQSVLMVSADELKQIFSEFVGYDFAFGCPVQARDQPAYIHVDRFFGRPVAVLGTTGSGKSCTVASILQQTIAKYPDTHIIVLDLHGEYATAFPDHCLMIEPEQVELPYWLLNFDEFVDLTVDANEFTAKNQISVLRDAILSARQATDRKKSLGLGDAVTVDSPIYFSIDDMMGLIRGYNIQMVQGSDGKVEKGPLYGVFDRFVIRFEGKLHDPRFRFMFAPTAHADMNSMADLLKQYLSIETGKRMAVIDLSGIPSEAVGVVVAVVSRLVFEFNLWNPERQKFPVLMVYEEAHNYLPSRSDSRFTTAVSSVERVAKEGRKYGVGSIVVSQRPKELSETILSQCNTFVVMRLTNPEDQAYVHHLVPDSQSGLMSLLPSLPTGEALLIGDAVAMPTRVAINCPDPKPMSADIEYAKWWANGVKDLDVDDIIRRWRSGQKNS